MLRRVSVILATAVALAIGCSSTPPVDCSSGTTCTVSSSATPSEISTAVTGAAAGTTFNFAAATYNFTSTLAIPKVNNLTFNGAGVGQTIFDFAGATGGADGFSAILGNSKIKFSNFTLQNAPGNGIKVELGNGVIFETVEVKWLNSNVFTHGPYGIYPVQSQNVVIDHCTISGARDTGAYVGQSFNVVVSNNTVFQNVAGIEIESSKNAEVYGNNSHDNTGGILVFALPGLQPPQGSGDPHDNCTNVNVHDNIVHANNTGNFADMSGTVAAVPTGSGIVILAADNVEVHNNTVTNNDTVAYAVASYILLDPAYNPSDPANNGLNPFAINTYAHDNTFSGNGASPHSTNPLPDGGSYQSQLGALFAVLAGEGTWTSAPDLIWDGIAPPPYVPPSGSATAGTPPNPLVYSIKTNGSAAFANVNLPVVCASCGTGGLPNGAEVRFDAADFTVTADPPGFPLPHVDAGL